jgi:two-component system, NarL family, nitrate/nitrite response regulator NarL
MPRLILIDDHALFRTSLSLVLGAMLPSWTVLQAGTLGEALVQCQASLHRPDLAVLDLHLPDVQGASGVAAWRQAMAGVPVLVLSGTDDKNLIDAALQAGALAFLSKTASPEDMVATLERCMPPHAANTGHRPSTPELDGLPALQAECPLTQRQLDVLRCTAQGLTSKATAEQLGMSEHTVRQHTAEAFRRLGVNNRAQAVLAAKPYLG